MQNNINISVTPGNPKKTDDEMKFHCDRMPIRKQLIDEAIHNRKHSFHN